MIDTAVGHGLFCSQGTGALIFKTLLKENPRHGEHCVSLMRSLWIQRLVLHM